MSTRLSSLAVTELIGNQRGPFVLELMDEALDPGVAIAIVAKDAEHVLDHLQRVVPELALRLHRSIVARSLSGSKQFVRK